MVNISKSGKYSMIAPHADKIVASVAYCSYVYHFLSDGTYLRQDIRTGDVLDDSHVISTLSTTARGKYIFIQDQKN